MTTPWNPKILNLEESLAKVDSLKFQDVVSLLRSDIVVLNKLWMPKSFPLVPFQRVTMRALADHQFIWIQACRGSSKSYMVARFILLWALMHKVSIVITAPTFRQALNLFGYVVEIIRENSIETQSMRIDQEVEGQPVMGGMEARIRFKNGSVIKGLPMSSGESIRGERADVLVCDETFKLERDMVKKHILPFLMRPEVEGSERPKPKLIMMTSAEYQDCFAFHFLTHTFLPKLQEEDKLVEADPTYVRKYCVLDWNIDDLRASNYNLGQDVLDLILSDEDTEEKERVLYNKWVGISGQFFPGNLIERLSSNLVKVEYSAEEGHPYTMLVDVATAKNGDNFIIQVFKMLGSRRMAFVNSYWAKGLSADDMAYYIHRFNDSFNPRFIIMDKGGGGLFVASSLAKRKLVLSDEREVTITNPIVMHNDLSVHGERKLVLTKPTDDLVRAAFSGQRARAGQEISTEDMLVHLLYDGMKKTLANQEPLILIPEDASRYTDEFGRTEIEILDLIRESIRELRHLALKIKEHPDGSKEIVRTKYNHLPNYVWKNAEKDGAVAFCYSIIPYLLEYGGDRGRVYDREPIIQRSMEDTSSMLQGLPDRLEGQFLSPFAVR